MKIANTKLTKTILIAVSAVLIAVVAIIAFISPVAKYLVEKYDVKFTGRQITVGWIYLNPFTGYVHISNLKVYESDSLHSLTHKDTVFFSAKGVSANFALLKLLSKTIEISEITLDQPKGVVIQQKKQLNFTDLIKFYTPEKPRTTPASIHFTILKICIIDGEFHYRENRIPINYYIKKVNIESTGKRWNSDTISATVSLFPGIGSGNLKGEFTINFKSLDYRYAVVVHKFDLNIIQQYMKELVNYGNFSASLDADLKGRGSFKDEEDMNASGMIAINDFHFGKTPQEDYASFEKLLLAIKEISPKNHQYLFDSLSLMLPFLKYERYDYLDNLQMMIGKNGSKIAAANADPAKFNLVIEIARYVKVLAKNFFRSDYKIDRLAIYKGDLKYNDFAISEEFSVDLNPLYIMADSIDKSHKWVDIDLNSGIKPFGNVAVTVSINPNDSMDFDIRYHLQKLPVSMFNPYVITYTSYPLDRGTLEINGTWHVRNGFIKSSNHLVLIDPRRTKRVRNKDKSWLPLPLIMSLIRERGNVIDYRIPITGNLKDPKFHLHDVLVDLLENIFVKPATSAYRLEVKNMESEIEKAFTLTWQMRKSSLQRNQVKFINKMVDYLVDNREASINVYPQMYTRKEKEYILFFEAKKKYFLLTSHKNAKLFNEDDSEKVDNMSVKDSLFVHYLTSLGHNARMFTIQEKCSNFVDSSLIDYIFNRLINERADSFLAQFKEKAVEKRVKFHPRENIIPYNGFSVYKVTYNGELPEAFIKAYRKMDDFNNKAPRKKYKNDRKKNRL